MPDLTSNQATPVNTVYNNQPITPGYDPNSIINQLIGGFGGFYTGQQAGNAASTAAGQEQQAIQQAINQAGNIYGKNAANFGPYIQAGQGAAGQLAAGIGPQGALGRQFTMTDFHQDPAYQWNVQNALNQIGQSNAVRGGALSGGAQKGMADYALQQGSNEYQNAYNRFTQNQQQNYNQLAGLSGMGLNATSGAGNLGMANSQLMGNLLAQLGASRAAGTVGQSTAQNQGLAQLLAGLTGAGSNGLWNQLGQAGSSAYNWLTGDNFTPTSLANYINPAESLSSFTGYDYSPDVFGSSADIDFNPYTEAATGTYDLGW